MGAIFSPRLWIWLGEEYEGDRSGLKASVSIQISFNTKKRRVGYVSVLGAQMCTHFCWLSGLVDKPNAR